MTISRCSALFLFMAYTLISNHLSAQQVPGTVWKQRETGNFILIYPENMSGEALNLAAALDGVLDENRNGLPVIHQHKKWPLVLTNLGVQANGYVTLAPRHSVWYAAPGEEITAVSDWWMLLARHEGRHMAQFDAADQGATRFLHALFGEIGWGAGIVMGTPSWLLEGDAVVQETLLSEEGRGRDPLFTMELTALVSENPESDYYHAVNPSLKNNIPDIYRVGYELASWIRKEYGEETLAEIFRSSARIPIPVVGLNTGTKRATGKKPKELYAELAADLRQSAAVLSNEIIITPAQIISPQPESFTRYDSLFDDGRGNLYARKTTLSEAPTLVRMSTVDGRQEENRLMRLPRGGRVSLAVAAETADTEHTPAAIRIAWNSIRSHPVYIGSSVSDITIVDLDSKGRVIRRETTVAGSRYLYPALSPDGSKLAAVDFQENSEGNAVLVVLDAGSGEELKRHDFHGSPPETPAFPSWSPDGEKLVFSLRSSAGRRIAEWRVAGDKVVNLTEEAFYTVKTPVYSTDGKNVFYSSNESGMEAIWTVGSDEPTASRWYGAYFPAPAAEAGGGNTIYVVEYASSLGERISRIELGPISTDTPTIKQAQLEPVPPEIPASQTTGGTVSEESAFPETDYKPASHALNIHSLGFSIPSGVNELHLGIRSQDVLGTLRFEAGALYEIYESSPGAFTDLSFTAIRPVIGIHGEYRYREPESDPFHQSTFSISALYPANLSRTGIWNHTLDIGAAAGLLSYYPVRGGEDTHYPYLSYTANWKRLRVGSSRAIRPELGWKLCSRYSQIPIPEDYGDSSSAQLKLFFPGGFKNTSLSLGSGIEYRTANFSPVNRQPRGYDWENPELSLLGTIDYEFPLGYPDLPLGSVIFIQRFRLGVFSDFANEGRWSTGAALTMDFSAFNNFPGLSLGIQFSWRWLDNTPRIEFMVMELPLF